MPGGVIWVREKELRLDNPPFLLHSPQSAGHSSLFYFFAAAGTPP